MTRLIRSFIALLTVMLATNASAALPSPTIEVERVTRSLMQNFKENINEYKSGPAGEAKFVAEVNKQLTPVVAFDVMARGVMGKYARQATPVQLKQFAESFKVSLINIYGKALLKLDDTAMKITSVEQVPEKVVKQYEAGKIRLIPVNMSVLTSKGEVRLSYSVVYSGGRWKMRNIIVDGVNIGIQFRNQFAEAMNTHKTVAYVVDNWEQLMQNDFQKKDQ